MSLLTRIPLPHTFFPSEWTADLKSLSVVFYPVVGLIIGLILFTIDYGITGHLNPMLVAAIVLIVWVAVTGALHIDGVADCADGIFAYHKDRSIILRVMKDPHVGAMAVTGVTLLLLTKFCLIYSLLDQGGGGIALLFAPIAGRLVAIFYMAYTPYVREEGLASDLDTSRNLGYVLMTTFIVAAIYAIIISLWVMIVTCAVLIGFYYLWRRCWIKKISGYTGDCVGALIEQCELIVLLMIIVSHS